MSTACTTTPDRRREIAKKVGDDLARRHGKQRYYTPQQVRASCNASYIPADFSCWAMALYTSRADFDAVHLASGEVCDYSEMHSQMLGAVAKQDSSWTNWSLDLSWIDFPDIDWSIFDFFDLP